MKDGKRKAAYVHRLVAEAFIPNPENKQEVNHKDANRTNNNVENLEWVTHLENMQHCEHLNLRTPNTKAANKAHEKKLYVLMVLYLIVLKKLRKVLTKKVMQISLLFVMEEEKNLADLNGNIMKMNRITNM